MNYSALFAMQCQNEMINCDDSNDNKQEYKEL